SFQRHNSLLSEAFYRITDEARGCKGLVKNFIISLSASHSSFGDPIGPGAFGRPSSDVYQEVLPWPLLSKTIPLRQLIVGSGNFRRRNMTKDSIEDHPVVSHEKWLSARIA